MCFTMGESVGIHMWVHLMRMEAFVSKKPLNIVNPLLVSTKEKHQNESSFLY